MTGWSNGGVRQKVLTGVHTLGELGGREEDIPALVKVLCRGAGRDGSISGFVTLTEEDCAKIYRMML